MAISWLWDGGVARGWDGCGVIDEGFDLWCVTAAMGRESYDGLDCVLRPHNFVRDLGVSGLI
jgi:hypothetical protein